MTASPGVGRIRDLDFGAVEGLHRPVTLPARAAASGDGYRLWLIPPTLTDTRGRLFLLAARMLVSRPLLLG